MRDQNAQLDALVGRYARGDAPIYRGKISAGDNLGITGWGNNGALAGDVTASLVKRDVYTESVDNVPHSAWTLTLFGPADTYMRVQQPTASPGLSQLTLIDPDGDVPAGYNGACSGCMADLSTKPATIAATSITANGTYWTGQSLVVVLANLTLTRVTPVAFEDIVAVADLASDRDTMRAFTQRGHEMVQTVTSQRSDYIPGEGSCRRITSYSVEWYVNRTTLTDFGTRKFEVTSRQTCCYPNTAQEASEVCQ
jgi:hypothetical protein